MALTRILRLSSSPSLHHCGRTFSTALHTRVVFPITINRDSKTCSAGKPLIGPFLRGFSTSPVVSDDMQRSVTEDLIYSVKSLRRDVESLRTEVSLLREVVGTIQNCNAQRIVGENDDGNDYVFESLTRGSFSEEISESDGEGNNNEKATEKMSDFSEAMATHFNTKIVTGQDNKAAEKMSDLSETGDNNEKATEKMSDVSEEIRICDTRDNNEKLTEKMSEFSEAMATDDTEIEESHSEECNNETVPDGKEQDPLLEEIESEISRAVDFSRVSSQGVNFPDDFPFKLENDFPGVASITLKRQYKLENIVVTVRKPSIFTTVTAENYHYYKSSNFIMNLYVEIFPVISEGRGIAFDCSAFNTGFLIENVYGHDRADTKGLVFRELNDTLKMELKKYLEMRGIAPSTTNIIFGYMLDKVNREKLRSLYKFKELVEA